MFRVKAPIEVGICTSCGEQLSTDGKLVVCPNGHHSAVDEWGRRMRKFAAWVRQWTASSAKKGSLR